jgi:hypothetical protein
MSTHETLDFPSPVVARPSRRKRTVRGARARVLAVELRRYFRTAKQLALALGVSRDTLRTWSAEEAPGRPRLELLDAAELTLTLCRAVRLYVVDDFQVGEWMLAPDPRLHGASPAQALRRHGRGALQPLMAGLAVIAPPRPDGPVELPSLEELKAALTSGVGAEALKRIERIAAAEPIVLTDAELDAELASVAAEDQSATVD